jgi:hypothetical protein
MTLGTRVTLVTTTVIASVLAVSGYAALKVRRANLEADLDREAHGSRRVARRYRAVAAASPLSELLHRCEAAREPGELLAPRC